MVVVLFYDLKTRDGRRAIEIRQAQNVGYGIYSSPKDTFYSCAYNTPIERVAAMIRAQELAKGFIITYLDGKENRAFWQ